MTHGGKEAALLRQGAGIGDHAEGVHLQAVVVVEAQWLMGNYPSVQPEAGGLQPLPGPGMAGVEDRQIVFFRHLIHRVEQG